MNHIEKKYKSKLSDEEYRVARDGETEPPFSGKYCNLFDNGIYLCVCCETPLFSSNEKFDSGSGWPDFHKAIDDKKIKYVDDYSSGLKRIEVKCNNCDAHLGHVFENDPSTNHKRY